jgi:hypothetical protein
MVQKEQWEILNNRGQRYGKTYPSREAAVAALDKKVTSAIARSQFAIQPISVDSEVEVQD